MKKRGAASRVSAFVIASIFIFNQVFFGLGSPSAYAAVMSDDGVAQSATATQIPMPVVPVKLEAPKAEPVAYAAFVTPSDSDFMVPAPPEAVKESASSEPVAAPAATTMPPATSQASSDQVTTEPGLGELIRHVSVNVLLDIQWTILMELNMSLLRSLMERRDEEYHNSLRGMYEAEVE